MNVGFIVDGSDAPEDDDVDVLKCEKCHAIEGLRIRTSTTNRLEGGRPLATVECASCGHTWKVIGTAPVRLLGIRRQRGRQAL